MGTLGKPTGGALSVMRVVDVNEAETREQQRRRDGKPSQCIADENTEITANAILNQLESDKSEREREDRQKERGGQNNFPFNRVSGNKKRGDFFAVIIAKIYVINNMKILLWEEGISPTDWLRLIKDQL